MKDGAERCVGVVIGEALLLGRRRGMRLSYASPGSANAQCALPGDALEAE